MSIPAFLRSCDVSFFASKFLEPRLPAFHAVVCLHVLNVFMKFNINLGRFTLYALHLDPPHPEPLNMAGVALYTRLIGITQLSQYGILSRSPIGRDSVFVELHTSQR